jgi:hypothetical protein
MKTMEELKQRALDDIENEVDTVYDIAAEQNQQVANVKHMTWFINLVMLDIALNDPEFSHLAGSF